MSIDSANPSIPVSANKAETNNKQAAELAQARIRKDLEFAIERIVTNPEISEPFRHGVLIGARRRANG